MPDTNSLNCSRLVSVIDDFPRRESTVVDLVRTIAAKPTRLLFGGVPALGSSVSVVGLPDELFWNDSRIGFIEELKRLGHFVITYADGAEAWTVRSKCQLMHAGAGALLDSSKDEFKSKFCEVLSDTLRLADESKLALETLHQLMRDNGIIGKSSSITAAFNAAVQCSKATDSPVLITGETGTGKELIAKAIARMDPEHCAGPFIAINCAAVPSTMMESELFGHRRGAFTGADRERKGWMRSAEGGILFLDEIGEMDLTIQAKFLRVLQDRRMRALGEDQDSSVNTRFLAATNRNLDEMVAQGKFRGDLLNRIQVLKIQMPALSERRDDMNTLVHHFILKHGTSHGNAGRVVADDYVVALKELEMPGNVRELENIVRRSIVNQRAAGPLGLSDLPTEVLSQLAQSANQPATAAKAAETEFEIDRLVKALVTIHGWNLQATMRECERAVCREVLKVARGNQTEAARLLGVSSRCVYNKVQKFGMS